MLLAEDLVLLALDPDKGKEVNSSAEPLKPSVTGALIAELALSESITLEGKRFVTTGVTPKDPLLTEVLVALEGGKNAKAQLKRVDKALHGSRNRVVDRLVDAQVLGREPGGLFGVTTHPVRQRSARDEVVARLREAAAGHGEIEPRTAVVLALSGPARLLEVVADKPHDHAKKRIAEATDLTPIAPVVKKVIQEAQAAITAAVVASSAAAAGS